MINFAKEHFTRGINRNVTVAATNFENVTYSLFNETLGNDGIFNGVIASASPPLFFPLHKYNSVWYGDGGCLVNMDVFTAIERCI